MHVSERFRGRVRIIGRAFAARGVRRARPPRVARILVAHNLLLGDTLMLTPLLAKLRRLHPDAEITLLASPSAVPLYAGRPYGVRAAPFKPGESGTVHALLDEPAYDLAIVPGDNRYAWLAAATRADHIVAHAGDAGWKNLFVDDLRRYPATPGAWGDMVADLVDGDPAAPYRRGDWPAPHAPAFDMPRGRYAVLHVGASTALKRWEAARWQALAQALQERGLQVAWSAGRGEEPLVQACDPDARWPSYAGRLSLAQLWHLLANASLLVAPDTGVAHLGRATWTPTVALFGPGSPVVCGPGDFWRDTPWRAVTVDAFPCRDQRVLFRRELPWLQRCGRTTRECTRARCMEAIALDPVVAAADALLAGR